MTAAPRTTARFAPASLAAAALCGLAPAFPPPAADGIRGDAGQRMAQAAQRFLSVLETERREQAQKPLSDPNRLDWHYVPRARAGVALGEMTEEERRAAQALLESALSARGYLKVNAVIALEEVLRELQSRPGNPATHRDPGLYHVTIFGDPASSDPWGWRIEGHHLSLNFTSATQAVTSVTPSFIGAQPAEIRHGPRAGFRALAAEEDLARELLASLTDAQREAAILPVEAPGDVILGPGRAADGIGERVGVAYAELTEPQRATLRRLIRAYAGNLDPQLAAQQLRRIRDAGLGQVRFAWAGSTQRGEGHYYRVHGPTFVIEYDNTRSGANHVHSVWRDLTRDFGGDILRHHYDRHPHE